MGTPYQYRIHHGPTKSYAERVAGYVYIIRRADGAHKIGHTNNLTRRLAQFRTIYPGDELKAVMVFKVKNRYDTETFLHRWFRRLCVGGEWFNLGKRELDMIRRWYSDAIVEAE
jgi:hypothetical protein